MAEQSEREVLHHLIEVCRDGEYGFRAAAENVRAPELKALFLELANERSAFATALVPHLQRLGGTWDGVGSNAAALHRGWMNLKGSVPGHHDETIVRETERGEHTALHAYDKALNGMLPPTVTDLLEYQRHGVQNAADRIRALVS